MSRERKLGDQGRSCETGKGESETDQESTTDKHANVLGRSLKRNTDDLDRRSEKHGPSSTVSIVDKRGKGKTDYASDRLDRVEQTESSAVWVVEVGFPSVERSAVSDGAHPQTHCKPFIILPS